MERAGADDQFLQFELPDLLNGLHLRFFRNLKDLCQAVMLQVVGGVKNIATKRKGNPTTLCA